MIETTDISGAQNDHATPCQIMPGKTTAAPAVASEIIMPRLAQFSFPD
jgi:hypothetical protein